MFQANLRRLSIASATLLASVSLLAQQTPGEPPPGPGLELMQRSCVGCHDIYMITSKRKTPDEWATILDVMATRGAEVTPDEMQIIEEYLSQHFAKTPENPLRNEGAIDE